MKTTAAVLTVSGAPLSVQEVQLGKPGPREALVEIIASGVCHSQLHVMQAPRAVPMLLGHEASGRVMEVGQAVTQVSVGDPVIIAAVPTIDGTGEIPGCPKWRWRGQEYDGTDQVNVFTWANHTLVDERNLTVIPPGLPLDTAAILGCAAVTGCGSVMNVGNLQASQSIIVWGIGGVGSCSVVAAAALQARSVIAVDIDAAKLDFARSLGATHVIHAHDIDLVDKVREITGGGVDCAVDTVGAATVQALQSLRPGIPGQSSGGIAVMVAAPRQPVTLDLFNLLTRGRRLVNSMAGDGRPQRDLQTYFHWYQQGLLPLHRLVTRRYPLADVNSAVASLRGGQTIGRAILTMR